MIGFLTVDTRSGDMGYDNDTIDDTFTIFLQVDSSSFLKGKVPSGVTGYYLTSSSWIFFFDIWIELRVILRLGSYGILEPSC